MELILISSNKLKVTLNKEETLKYNIPTLDGSASLSDKKSIRLLLCDIRKMSGFDTESDNLLIEIFESYAGGCEIFITRDASYPQKTYTPKEIRQLCKSCLSDGCRIAYIFNSSENLISACRALYNRDINAYSSAYIDSLGRYYLLIKSSDHISALDATSLFPVNEFGELAEQKYIREYLSEHATLICDNNAISTLANV